MHNFFTQKIYHYTSGPMDRAKCNGYISLLDIKNEIIKLCSSEYSYYGPHYFISKIQILLKRSLVEIWDKRWDFRDDEIWVYPIRVMYLENDDDCRYTLKDLYLYIKEDNNGTSHLFSFNKLPEKLDKDGNTIIDFPHEYEDIWEIYPNNN